MENRLKLTVRVKSLFPLFLLCCQKKTLKNYEKCALFYRKSSFHSRDIQNFGLSSSPLFSFGGHRWAYRRSQLKINPKVYDVIMYLNRNLKNKLFNPNLVGRAILPPPPPPFWFYYNKSEMVIAVTLIFCSIR